jgi:aspartate racemase
MLSVQVKVERMIEPLRARLRLRSAPSHAYALKALEATHEQARMHYKPRPYKGRVIVFRANRQPLGIHPDPTLGWSKLVEGELDIQEVPGYPIGMLSEPRVQIVAEQLRVCIHKAQVGVLGE